jgi:mannose-6-phosphate isomerase-like protein (cupin superfamily)
VSASNDSQSLQDVFLGGRVRRQSLPSVTPPFDPAVAPSLKRLLLPQGELAQVYDAAEGIRYLACLELQAGTRRGDHYHKSKQEWVYLVRGEVTLEVADIATRVREEVPLRSGDLVCIAPGVAHALRTEATGFAVEFSPVPFDPVDTFRFPVR